MNNVIELFPANVTKDIPKMLRQMADNIDETIEKGETPPFEKLFAMTIDENNQFCFYGWGEWQGEFHAECRDIMGMLSMAQLAFYNDHINRPE